MTDPDTHIVPVNELRDALNRIGADYFVGVPDVDTAILDLPRRDAAAVMYAVNRGLATDREPLTLTDQGRRVLDLIGGPVK